MGLVGREFKKKNKQTTTHKQTNNKQQQTNKQQGHVYLTHLLRTGLLTMVENDATRPSFTKLVSHDRKILGDNPDAFYYTANVCCS